MADKKIVALFDIHVPDNIPLKPIFAFIGDFKPNVLILGGDVANFDCVSSFLADQSRHLDSGTVKEEYDRMRKVVLDPIEAVVPKGAELVFLEGNHCNRLVKACQVAPNLRGYVELEKNVGKRWKVYPINVPYMASADLAYTHGTHTGKYHAKQMVEDYHTSVLYGHSHTLQTHLLVSPVHVKKFYKGQCCGCLSNLNPEYMKNRPNAWVNGFNYAFVEEKTGHFWDTQVTIVGGKFYAEGRKYGGD